MKLKIPFDLSCFKKIKKNHLLLAVLAGILLLVIVIPVGDDKDSTKDAPVQETEKKVSGSGKQSVKADETTYRDTMENRLKTILTSMDGVGNVEVMITWKDDGETVVEKDLTRSDETTKEEDGQGTKRESRTDSTQEETVLAQTEGSNSSPFVTKEVNPRVEGVLVVAQGAKSPVVMKNISDAVLALFPIEAHKIKVVRMNE